jgi:hypothetical protein
MILFYLLKVVSSFIVKVELSTLALVGSVVVSIDSGIFPAGLINFKSFTQTAKPSLILVSVNETKSKHVVANDKILIKLGNQLQR